MYAEIHFHLLPGVDDGPASLDESVALANAAVRDGTSTVVATPHVLPGCVTDPSEIPARVDELVDRLRRERIGLDVLSGGEIGYEMVAGLSTRQLDAIAQGPKGKRWLLLEAPFTGLDRGFTEAADELRARGFAVVVAHPERAEYTPTTDAVLEHELTAGSVFQLTSWSLAGLWGEHVRRRALRMLHSTPRPVIASDAHGSIRMPGLSYALDLLAAAGVNDAPRFADAQPRALLTQGLNLRPTARAA